MSRPSLLASRLAGKLAGFRACNRGHTGLLFAITMMPVLLSAGAAIDYSRASDLLARLQAGTDATTLTLCQAATTITTTDLKAKAQTSIQNYLGTRGTATVTDLSVTNSPRTVTVTSASSYPTAFMRIVGQNSVPMNARASCMAPENYYEIALVLDTTGSMNNSAGGGQPSKIASAKVAAKNFVDYMYSTGALPGHVRISLVPFAASVAIPSSSRTASWLDTSGLSPAHWQYVSNPAGSNFTSRLSIFNQLALTDTDWAWQGCVESPLYPFNVKDDPVSVGQPGSLIMPLFAPDEVANTVVKNGRSQQDKWSLNSYLDDGSSSTGSCQNDATDQTRFTQACKYVSRTDPRNNVSSVAGPNQSCTSRPLSILGTQQTVLKSEIDALVAGGSTNVHEGFMWGWRTISPTSVFSSQSTPPVAYNTDKYIKIIVLMTDGENTWSSNNVYGGDASITNTSDSYYTIGGSTYSAYGYFNKADGTSSLTGSVKRFSPSTTSLASSSDGRRAIDTLLLEACANAKAKGITVYTVGFSVTGDTIDQQGQQVLQQCATTPGDPFFTIASDGNSLVTTFQKIAQGIGSLRLTK